jgi:transposase-like protein
VAGQSQWTEETRLTILEKLSEGNSLRSICAEQGMPSESLVRKWTTLEPEFGTQYARAREAGMDAMADEILAIADDVASDYKETADGRKVIDQEAINRSRLRVDARKWLMSKIAPKTYGDKLDLNHSGNIGSLDESAVDARLAELLRKAGLAGTAGTQGTDQADDPA